MNEYKVNLHLFHNMHKVFRLRIAHNPPMGLCAFLTFVKLYLTNYYADMLSDIYRHKGERMIKYILKRLLQLIPILIGITFLSFAMMRLAGGEGGLAAARSCGRCKAAVARLIDFKQRGRGPPVWVK